MTDLLAKKSRDAELRKKLQKLQKAISPFIEFLSYDIDWMRDPVKNWYSFAQFKILESAYREVFDNPFFSLEYLDVVEMKETEMSKKSKSKENDDIEEITKYVVYGKQYDTHHDALVAIAKNKAEEKLKDLSDNGMFYVEDIVNNADKIIEILSPVTEVESP